ncbi:ABC transporter substrate-binding protein [Nocardioides soli]|uniref:Iron complex transport system substrate-binding protein n=1 Tax=Nocardioides soli TaxID=1036020 RepID=A0A7W4Z4V9_9ACTN|nr:ABC transporter substrate-binding protein [Nocardioides soli]MBB3045155.1 iron complex transport system substrate-binding protein [Nocardioides soli]
MSMRPPTRGLRRAIPTLVAIAFGLSLAGCSDAESAEKSDASTRVFTADNGDITIPADPDRIVATGYAVPVLIEADADLVGISEWSRGVAMMTEADRATYEELPKVAGEVAAETNYEAVAQADPDLIVIGVPQPALVDLDMEKLESIAPVVVIGPSMPDSWKTISEKQADAAGATDGFEQARAAYLARAQELEEKYADALAGVEFGHVGAYGDVAAGQFHREFAGSWGTNVATDIGVTYYGEVAKKGGGSEDVSEYPAIEELPESLGDADAITYSLDISGEVSEAVQYVLDSKLWKNLPAVRAGNVFPIRYTEAATYTSALMTLDSLDAQLEKLK